MSAKNVQIIIKDSKISKLIADYTIHIDELSLTVAPQNLHKVVQFLKDDKKLLFKSLISICGVDYFPRNPRFEVIYNFLSIRFNYRVRVRVQVNEGEFVPSLCPIFRCANWYERETYDLFGIFFSKHPDLRRILNDYRFQGYPLRKDFPVTGYLEVSYDYATKKVEHEEVELTQDFRNFEFESPWEGANYILPGDEKVTKNNK
jgi:NADH-quinone oxidoreductase subunit C